MPGSADRTLRVALVCPYDLSVPGGAQYQVLGLAAELSRLDVSVAVLGPGRPAEGPLRSGTVSYASVGTAVQVSANGSRAPVALFPPAAWRTTRVLRTGAFDVVHIHEPMVPLVGLAALLASPAPIVATFHRAGLDALYRLEGRLFHAAARRIGLAVAVSEAARETAGEALRIGSIQLVPNGVVLGGPDRPGPEGPAPDRARSEPRLTAHPGPEGAAAPPPVETPAIAFVGRHEERKGLGVLLEAFARLGSPARLVVMGDGPQTAAIRSRYAGLEGVEWAGRVNEAEKAARLGAAEIACAPSIGGESFGVVLLEAMAAGTAVVASDLPGYRLAAGGAAWLVPPGDASALAGALRRLLTDDATRFALAAAGRKRAEELGMGRVAARYLELYRSIAS